MASTASTNLSFLYFLQGDNDAAENYAELAKDTDSYNAAAFVNLGNFVNRSTCVQGGPSGRKLYYVDLNQGWVSYF